VASRLRLALAGAAGLSAIAIHLGGVARVSVDIPFLDDWDAVLGFQVYWLRADSLAARLRLLFDPHNEHLLALPRSVVLAVTTLTGRVDFTWLNLIGNSAGVVLLAALWPRFAAHQPTSTRAVAFLPAILCVMQPQAWTAVLSPTVSLQNLGVLALAASCYATLAGSGRLRLTLAAALAIGASLCSANGILVAPLGSGILWLRGERRQALVWGAFAGLAAAAYLIAAPSDHAASNPLDSLAHPDQLIAYFLHFVGSALGFGHPLPALLGGIALGASFAALVARGLPRRSPVVFSLALFVFVSIAANALLRAHEGGNAPLFQPRYRLYAAVLLALTHLAWVDLLRGDARRHWTRAALVAALVFWGASSYTGGAAARAHAAQLDAGLAHWWQTGDGGLRHPDARKAAFFLHAALDANLLRLPADWGRRFGVPARNAELPQARTSVSVALDAAAQQGAWLVVLGRARVAGASDGQSLEIALAGERSTHLAPALSVAGTAGAAGVPGRAWRRDRSGFHAFIDARSLAPGSYRLGVVVRQGERRHFAWTNTTLAIAGTR
jgi:hypothetical protein